MSVRTEPRELSERLHGALNLSADQLQQQGIKLQEPSGTAVAYQGEQMMVPAQTSTSAGGRAAGQRARARGGQHLQHVAPGVPADPHGERDDPREPERPVPAQDGVGVGAELGRGQVDPAAGTRSLESLKTTQRAYPRLTNSPFVRPRSASTPTSPAVPKIKAISRALSCTS